MTCEVAVMNRFGVALAADSALTVGNAEKIYHHAQKLFALKPTIPVGIMVSGSAELMGMPWEIVIRLYAQTLGDKRFDRLEQYAEDFFRFIESATSLFPESNQREWFRESVRAYWKSEILNPLSRQLKQSVCSSSQKTHKKLACILMKENDSWERDARLDTVDESRGESVLANYGSVLDELESQLFDHVELNPELRHALRMTVKHLYSLQLFAPNADSEIVFAGMGEAEPFPIMRQYEIGIITDGVLHWAIGTSASISREDSAIVVPFAQTDMIDMFYRGIDAGLDGILEAIVAKSIADELKQSSHKLTAKEMERVKKRFRKALNEQIDNKYARALITSVDALPRHDLAKMAEALINLTALRRHMTVDQKETVGGRVDVAILSKCDGFIWVKSEDLGNRWENHSAQCAR
jgi:hypothetical protein